MNMMSRIVASMIVCVAFAAGCAGESTTVSEQAPATADEQLAESEQSSLAQEREVTYFAEAAKINEVGGCLGPYRCYGPKGLVCWGQRTPYATTVFYSCE